MPTASCPTPDVLRRFGLGDISDLEFDSVASHIEICADCQSSIEALENRADPLVGELRHASQQEPFEDEPALQQVLRRIRPSFPAAIVPRIEFGRYVLIESLGAGGMGAVYRAKHTRLDRFVAVKVLLPERTANPESVERFRREIQIAGALDHPNIVRATDADEVDGTHYLVMDLVDGVDLSRLVKHNGPLRMADACEIVRQVAVGLQHAHANGLVHRDIKPSNVMVTRDGVVKILDFGLARLREDSVAAEITSTGQLMGTVDYMSPEQAKGLAKIDIRADIYSLGCTLFKLLTGQAPYSAPEHAQPWEKLAAHTKAPIPSLKPFRSDVPENLDALLQRMLAKNRHDRFRDPGEVVAALEPHVGTSALSALAVVGSDAPLPHLGNGSQGLTAPRNAANATLTFDRHSGAAIREPRESSGGEGARAADYGFEEITRAWHRLPKNLKEGIVMIARAVAARPGTSTSLAAVLLLAFLFVPQIIVRIKTPSGEEATHRYPSGSTVTVETTVPGAEVLTEPAPRQRSSHPEVGSLTPEASPPASPRAPLSRMALVPNPARIEGVESWTLETYGHRGEVRAAAFSFDGSRLATAGADATIRIWDSESGHLLRALVGHDAGITALAWSPDGQHVAAASSYETARIWKVDAGKIVRTFPRELGSVHAISWSPTGNTVALASDASIYVWELDSNADPEPLQGHLAEVRTLAWSPDGRFLASGSDDWWLRIWDVETRQPWHNLDGHTGWIRSVAWKDDGETIVSGHSEGKVRYWSRESGTLLHEVSIPDETRNSVIMVSPDATMIAAVLLDETVQLYDARMGKPIRVMDGNAECMSSTFVWSPQSDRLLCGGMGCASVAFLVWDAGNGTRLHRSFGHHGQDPRIAFSPNGLRFTTASDLRVQIWETETGEFVRQSEGALAVSSPGGDMLALAGRDHDIWLRDAETSRPLKMLRGHEGDVVALAWSPSGKALVSAGMDHSIIIWDAETGEPRRRFQHAGTTAGFSWSPDASVLAFSALYDDGAGGDLWLWDANAEGDPRVVHPQRRFVGMDWSLDGQRLACAGHERRVEILDPATGEVAQSLRGHAAGVLDVAWFADDTKIATSSFDGTTRIWDVKTGQVEETIHGAGAGTFSLDGRWLASRQVAAIRLWDVANTHPGHTIVMLSERGYVSFDAAGTITSSTIDRSAVVYVMQTEMGQESLTDSEFDKRYATEVPRIDARKQLDR